MPKTIIERGTVVLGCKDIMFDRYAKLLDAGAPVLNPFAVSRGDHPQIDPEYTLTTDYNRASDALTVSWRRDLA